MLSDYARNLLLDWLYTTDATTRPTTWFVSFHTADPGLTGTDEVGTGTDAAYTRKSVTFAAASGGLALSASDVAHTADAGATAYTITHIGVWDAASGGNLLQSGELAVPENVTPGGSVLLATGRLRAALS